MVRRFLAVALTFACVAACTPKASDTSAGTTTSSHSGTTEYALTDKPGVVAPDTKVNLPGGRGAFASSLDTGALTGATPTITVVGGYSYTFPCLVAGKSAKLVFGVANPIPGGDSVRVTVTTRVKNYAPRIIFTKVLPKLPKKQKVVYPTYTVALPASDDCTEITFWTKPVSGGMGAWATFLGPTVKGLPESS